MVSHSLTDLGEAARQRPKKQGHKMTKTLSAKLALTAFIGIVGLTACSTQSMGQSRYGGEYYEYGYGWAQESAQEGVCCGYYVVPIHHIITNEKQVEVEKEVIKEVVKELPPQVIYQNSPCPPDTTADANGACIKYVDRPQPCYGQPCQPTPPVIICQREDGLPCKK